jgi:Tol biopolymer transport system component
MKTWLKILVVVFATVAILCAAETGQSLFQKALTKERADADPAGAILLYERVVKEFPGDRKLAAEALFRIGECHLALGNAAARQAFERLVHEFSDQPDIAAQARSRLARLEGSEGARHPSTVTLRKVWAGNAEQGSIDPSASVSEDGRFLSFADESSEKWGNLAIHDLTTGENRLITSDADGDNASVGLSVVSPDCRQIAYTWHAKDKPVELRIVTLNGAKPRTLTHFGSDTEYVQFSRWSSDGKQIPAVIYMKNKRSQIVLISAADGSIRVLLESPQWRSPGNISLSPDGRYFVYDMPAREGASDHDIFSLPVDGGKELALVQHPADDYGPVWTPDGRMVLFASDRMGSVGFWAIPAMGGKPVGPPVLVKRDIGQLSSAIGFTRDGSYYYAVSTAMEDVYVAEMDSATGRIPRPPVRLPERYVGSNMGPVWSPDGRYLAYNSRRGREFIGPGALTIVIRSAETGEERDLSTKLIQIAPVSWFPDGKSLLVPVYEDEKQEKVAFYRVDVRTAEASLIRGGFAEDAYSSALSPDGSAIFYRQNEDSKTSVILAYRIKSGKVEEFYQVTPPQRIGQLSVSQDGRQLAFGVGDVRSSVALRTMPTSGGEPRELLRIQSPENLVYSFFGMGQAWTPDGRYLLAMRSTKGRISELLRVPAAGGEAQKTGLVMERISHLSVHPDGRRIAFDSGIRGNHEIWVMEDFLPALKSAR